MLLGTGSTKRCIFCIFRASEISRKSLPFAAHHHSARWSSSKISPLAGGGPLRIRKTFSGRPSEASTPYLEPKRYKSEKGSRRSRSRPVKKSSEDETTFTVFGRLLEEQVLVLEGRLLKQGTENMGAWDINSRAELKDALYRYRKHLRKSIRQAENGDTGKTSNPVFYQLRASFVEGNVRYLADELKHSFITFLINPKLKMSVEQIQAQQRLADLQYPTEWFPATRAVQRTIHLHIGPTNSGKTYHALRRLEAAKTGIYAGPLRLLAHEVYSRFNAKGKACALVTGEEKRVPEGLNHVMQSCTVEMVPLNAKVDVAVIDEIQMLGDEERGWAWTQAFLGVQAKEVHLCGEVRTEELIKNICALTGEKLIIHNYQRLNPLEMEPRSLGGRLADLKKGDAIIIFTRVGIHAMKSSVEKITGRRCAVVYGSLPPETRAQQAALFNDPDNDYDFLVASDAVGMGLNLSIRRVIFEATSKNDGHGHRLIRPWEIKQIAGRAGRFKTAQEAVSKENPSLDLLPVPETKKNIGYVTTLEKFDLPIVHKAMETEVKPLKSAVILPPDNVIHRFASYFPPDIPFSYIYLRLYKMAATSPLFKLARLKEQIQVADLIQHVDLTTSDRMVFMNAPVALRDEGFSQVVIELASCVANRSGGELLNLQSLNLELLELDIHEHPDSTKGYLKEAESLHKALTLYLWLSYRYDGVFTSQALAFHTKSLVEKKIDECLAEAQWDENQRQRQLKRRMKELLREAHQREVSREVGGEGESDDAALANNGLHMPSDGPREPQNSISA